MPGGKKTSSFDNLVEELALDIELFASQRTTRHIETGRPVRKARQNTPQSPA